MKIAMIGAGYVGLVSGVCFANLGHDVVCIDVNKAKVEGLRNGHVPIYEPGLDELIQKNVAEGRLSFSTSLKESLPGNQAVFIAVGTPSRRGDGHADLTFVYAAAEEIAKHADDGSVVVTKSTVPVGTNRKVKDIMMSNGWKKFHVVSNPEFLKEGHAIDDFLNPDRIVVGIDNDDARKIMSKIYEPLISQRHRLVFTGVETAEMSKYASNAFLATKIAFINEMALLCEKVGADILDVAMVMGLDQRIGKEFLKAGPGYGGSCFPKDTKALTRMGWDADSGMEIVERVVRSNDHMKRQMTRKIIRLCNGSVRGKKIAVLGVTFKPETDDMRDAPSLTILPVLDIEGAEITICDPQGAKEGSKEFPFAHWCDDPYQAANGADLVVVLTEWQQFRNLDLKRLARECRVAALADLRNLYCKKDAFEAGFEIYEGVGR